MGMARVPAGPSANASRMQLVNADGAQRAAKVTLAK
jgi:hypothetical protein